MKYAARQNGYLAAPPAFGEPTVKARIKNVLGFQKRGAAVSLLALLLLGCLAAGLLLRPGAQGESAPSPGAAAGAGPEASPQEGAHTPPYYGSFEIQEAKALGISALSPEEMDAFIGVACQYGEDVFLAGGRSTAMPQYAEQSCSRQDFEAAFKTQASFGELGFPGDSVTQVTVENAYGLGSRFYIKDADTLWICHEGAFFRAARTAQEEGAAFALKEGDKAYLAKMCAALPDFSGYAAMNWAFFQDFLFNAYTCDEGAGYISLYREDLGFAEGAKQVPKQEAEALVMEALGCGLPAGFEERAGEDARRAAFYYRDGCYYIAVSDSPDYRYSFLGLEEGREANARYALVRYGIDFEDRQAVGEVRFTLELGEDSDGFIIRGKERILY